MIKKIPPQAFPQTNLIEAILYLGYPLLKYVQTCVKLTKANLKKTVLEADGASQGVTVIQEIKVSGYDVGQEV